MHGLGEGPAALWQAAADESGAALHLVKMAVGIGDIDELRQVRAERLSERGWNYVYTRHRPRREAAVLAGGSIYWVIRGQIRVRQRVIGFHTKHDDNERAYCLIEVDPELVPTLLRPLRPFQGWRYLRPPDAPPDSALWALASGDAPPEAMLRELRALGLL